MTIMQPHTFFDEVEKHLQYLAYGSFSFEGYLKMSFKNGRVRNAFVFYALSTNEYRNRFFLLSSRSRYVQQMKNHLHKGLVRVTKNDLCRDEAVQLAQKLLHQSFRHQSVVVDYTVYDESAEMEKFLVNVVHHYYHKAEDTEEKKQYRDQLLQHVNLEDLFVKT